MGIEPRHIIKSELAKEFAEWMKTIHKEAQAALSKACDDMQHYADFNWGITPKYKVGDKVWLSSKNLNVVFISNIPPSSLDQWMTTIIQQTANVLKACLHQDSLDCSTQQSTGLLAFLVLH